MAFAHTTRARLSLVPPKRVQIHDAAGFASCCGPAGCAPPTGDRRSTSTPASRPTPGAPLPRTLASPRTGLTPAGCPELDARLHPNLLSCPDARTAGRTSGHLHSCSCRTDRSLTRCHTHPGRATGERVSGDDGRVKLTDVGIARQRRGADDDRSPANGHQPVATGIRAPGPAGLTGRSTRPGRGRRPAAIPARACR